MRARTRTNRNCSVARFFLGVSAHVEHRRRRVAQALGGDGRGASGGRAASEKEEGAEVASTLQPHEKPTKQHQDISNVHASSQRMYTQGLAFNHN